MDFLATPAWAIIVGWALPILLLVFLVAVAVALQWSLLAWVIDARNERRDDYAARSREPRA